MEYLPLTAGTQACRRQGLMGSWNCARDCRRVRRLSAGDAGEGRTVGAVCQGRRDVSVEPKGAGRRSPSSGLGDGRAWVSVAASKRSKGDCGARPARGQRLGIQQDRWVSMWGRKEVQEMALEIAHPIPGYRRADPVGSNASLCCPPRAQDLPPRRGGRLQNSMSLDHRWLGRKQEHPEEHRAWRGRSFTMAAVGGDSRRAKSFMEFEMNNSLLIAWAAGRGDEVLSMYSRTLSYLKLFCV